MTVDDDVMALARAVDDARARNRSYEPFVSDLLAAIFANAPTSGGPQDDLAFVALRLQESSDPECAHEAFQRVIESMTEDRDKARSELLLKINIDDRVQALQARVEQAEALAEASQMLDHDHAKAWALVTDQLKSEKAALQERAEAAESALLEWWDDPDIPPLLAARLAREREDKERQS